MTKQTKQGWEQEFNRKFDPDKGTWWRKDLYKSNPERYTLAVEYNKDIKHFIRNLLSLQREEVRREVVEEVRQCVYDLIGDEAISRKEIDIGKWILDTLLSKKGEKKGNV